MIRRKEGLLTDEELNRCRAVCLAVCVAVCFAVRLAVSGPHTWRPSALTGDSYTSPHLTSLLDTQALHLTSLQFNLTSTALKPHLTIMLTAQVWLRGPRRLPRASAPASDTAGYIYNI